MRSRQILGGMTDTTSPPDFEDDDRLLSRREVEERFGIPRRFLELAVTNHSGPQIVRLGRSVRYRVRDVRAWIDAQARAPTP